MIKHYFRVTIQHIISSAKKVQPAMLHLLHCMSWLILHFLSSLINSDMLKPHAFLQGGFHFAAHANQPP